MEEKTKELIAIGASVAANCQPCLTHHVDRADELGISEADIQQALAIGAQVQKGGMNAMHQFIQQSFDAKAESMSLQKKKKAVSLKVYDPPMCCSTGVCGTSVSEQLVEFAGMLKKAEAQGIEVHRFNLSQEPQAFAENKAVRESMAELGQEGLPLVYVDDELVVSGRYPDKKELFELLGLDEPLDTAGSGKNTIQGAGVISLTGSTTAASGECCPGGGCC
ncbi:MAG: arsenite efflux transporter metallochaperone ArsD [Desulfobacterales bacterium]|nr:arsenite efflux transporter metallochaperone ArsD [Desulfobacterales bacterium]